MNYRYATLQVDKTLGESGTEIIPINFSDVITAIEIHLTATSASTAWANHMAANITSIELVDGSDVLYSLNGKCAEAVDFYQTKRPRPIELHYRNGKANFMTPHINFGRYWGDRELAFDPKKFKNPQLKITWDIDVSNTSASAGTYHVKALVFDENQPSPIGFLMSKEIKAYTPSSGTWEYTDLPIDHPMRTLGIQCLAPDCDIATSLADVKLSEDQDKRIPINDIAEDLAALFGPLFGRYHEQVFAALTTSLAAYYCTPGWATVVTSGKLSQITGVSAQSAAGCRFNAMSETSGCNCQFDVHGLLPHQVLPIPFGRRDVIEDWYDVTKLGSLRLSLKGGSASTGTYRILTEQLRRY